MTSAAAADVREPIAIVGIGCRLPGGVDGPAAFWQRLLDGFDAIEPVPADRFDVERWFDERPATPGRIMSRWGGFVAGVDEIDAEFFHLAPREAERLDPQQRLLLETSWEALEDAGIAADRLAGTDTGVFVGLWLHDFESRLFADAAGVDFHMTTGSGAYTASGRISYVLDLLGPSITVDTACSSSLVAVHLACQALRDGECAVALAGGANVILQPHITVAYSQSRMMAPDGRCKFGDAAADGYVRSDGAAMVVLKPLRAAITDGDPVYAVIRGSAVTNDGSSSGFLATPGQAGQETMLRRAYAHAGVEPSTVQYVEAHGTGTAAGDPVELGALGAVVGAGRSPDAPCLVGSVKSNIGHTEGAAGVAGLVKAALALRHGVLPASLHVHRPNPAIPWSAHHLAVCDTAREWPASDGPRRAGVSAFGIAGTNAHVVLEEAPAPAPAAADPSAATGPSVLVLPLSARSAEALVALARRWRTRLEGAAPAEVAALVATAARRRAQHEHRLAVVGRTADDLVRSLTAAIDGEDDPAAFSGRGRLRGPVVFVCPGQGGQWPGMAQQLLAMHPAFADAVHACSAAMAPLLGCSIADQLAAGLPRIDDIDVVQPALFAVQVGLAAVWRSWGVEPSAVVGHSLGEVAAAVVAGALSVDDGARVIAVRSTLLRRISGQGAMAVVELSLDDAGTAIRGMETDVSVAVSNGPTSSVLAGTPDAIDRVLARLEPTGVFCRRINVDVASHSPQVEPLLPELADALRGLQPRSTAIDFRSTVAGRAVDGAALGAAYWVSNLRQPVRFGDAVQGLIDDGAVAFVELGPHPVLQHPIRTMIDTAGRPAVAVCSLRRAADEDVALAAALAELYASGVPIDWTAVAPAAPAVDAPTYPWQRERFWWEPATASGSAAAGPREHPLLGRRLPIADADAGVVWENDLDAAALPDVYAHRIGGVPSMPAAALLEAVLEATGRDVRDVRFERLLGLDDAASTRIQVHVGRDAVVVHGLTAGAATRHLRALVADHHRDIDAGAPAAAVLAAAPRQAGSDPEALLRELGVELGPPIVRRLAIVADGVVADIDRAARAGLGGALDAGLRAVAVGVGPWTGTGGVWMPTAAGAVRVGRPSGRPDRVAVSFVRDGDADVVATVTVLDDGGAPLVVVEGLALRPLGSAGSRVEDGSYEVTFIADDDAGAADPTSLGAVVLVGAGSDLGDALFESLGPTVPIVSVAPGDDAALTDAVRRHHDAPVHVVHFTAPAAATDLAAHVATEGAALAGTARVLDDAGARARLFVVTRGGQPATTDGPIAAPVDPAAAAAWGLGRAIREEMPHVWGGLVDLDPHGTVAADAAALVAELTRSSGDEAAWRGGRRLLARLVAAAVPPASSLRLDPGGAVLVAGGFGAVGARTARWLVEQGVRHLVLLGRTPLPPRERWATLDPRTPQGAMAGLVVDLERSGASVHAVSVDLGADAEVQAFAARYRAEARPPIRAVFHAAATFDSVLVRDLDAAVLARHLEAKAFGAARLAGSLADLELFVAFSSIAALAPQPYQGAYAAANAFLDAWVQDRRAAGHHALAVDWGVWRGAAGALVGEQWAARSRQIEAQGMRAFDPETGLDALARYLSADRTHAVFAPFDWDVYRSARHVPPLLSALAAAAVPSAADAPAIRSFRDEVRDAHATERGHLLDERVRAITAQVLKLPARRVEPDRPFGALGVDSLMAIEIRNRIEAATGVALSATVIWNHPTVSELAAHVLGRLDASDADRSGAAEPATARGVAEGSPTSVDAIVAAADDLADDDVVRLLMGGDRS